MPEEFKDTKRSKQGNRIVEPVGDFSVVNVPIWKGNTDQMFQMEQILPSSTIWQHFLGFLMTSFGVPKYEWYRTLARDGYAVIFVPPPRGWQYPSHSMLIPSVGIFLPDEVIMRERFEVFMTQAMNKIIHGREEGKRR